MNIYSGFNSFKNSLMNAVYSDDKIDATSYKTDGVQKKASKSSSSLVSCSGRIKWILEKRIEQSKNYQELENNIQSAVKEVSEVIKKKFSDSTDLKGLSNTVLKIQEKVTNQIQSVQKEFGDDALEESVLELETGDDYSSQQFSKNKIGPVISAESERYHRIRNAVKEMYLFSLVFAEYAALKYDKNWSILLNWLQEQTFKDYTYEVHYLNIKTGKIITKEIVEHETSNLYKFHQFEDQENILSISVFQPKPRLGKSPVAIYMHGLDPTSLIFPGHKNPQFCALAQLGYAIIAPNYRGVQGKELDDLAFEDVQATLNYIKTREDLEHSAVLTGISMGTYRNSVILDRFGEEIKGAFLHTGFYGNDSPSPFDHIKGIRRDLPIFVASGVQDLGNTGVGWVVKYMRALEDVCDNFCACLLEEGGHHLISLKNPDIPPLKLENIKEDIKNNKLDLNAIIEHTSQRYNSEEFIRYVSQLVEFFDKLGLGEVPNSIEIITTGNKKTVYPRGSDLLKKVKVSQSIKAKNLETVPLRIDQTLLNAPYTPSQAHLIALVGSDDLSVESLVGKFLAHYDTVKRSISEEFFKEYGFDKDFWKKSLKKNYADDKQLHSLVCSIINKEIEYKGSYVQYHGANAAAGFIYDVYSVLHRLLLIQADNKDSHHIVSRLRALDDAFLKFRSADDLINKMKQEQVKDKINLFNYMPGYQDVGLSTQWFLFGSYKYWFNSTFFRYFLGNASASDVNVGKILRAFFQAVGITDEVELSKMVKQFNEVFKDYIDERDGRLLQIFVSPEIIDNVAYVAETGGAPLELMMDDTSPSSHFPSKIISRVVQNPESFEAELKNNRVSFKNQSNREEFTKEKEGLTYMNSVEGRFFMDPKYMDDPEKIQIINYHSHPPKEGYEKALEKAVEKSLTSWLDIKPKLGPGMTYHKPPLVILQEYVNSGTGGGKDAANKRTPFSLYDLLSSGNWKEAEEWIRKHPDDISAKVDPQERTLLYQLLMENKFVAAKHFLAMPSVEYQLQKIINARDAKGYPLIYDLLFEGNFKAAEFLLEQHPNLRLAANNNSMIVELLKNDKFEAARFLTRAKGKLNISDTHAKSILEGNLSIEAEREKFKNKVQKIIMELSSCRIDSNTKLLNELKNDSNNWKYQAEKILELNPGRNLVESRENGKYNTNLLYSLIRDNKWDRARWLIDNGADLNALHCPFEDQLDNQPILYSLFVSSSIQEKNKFYRLNCLDLLIDNGANIDCLVKDEGAEEPLLSHLFKKTDLKDARYLIGKGANVNIAYGEKGYPLLLHKLISLKSEYIESDCGLLIEKGADVNARSTDGHLILTTLLMLEKVDAVKFLIKVGGDIDYEDLKLKTKNGVTVAAFLEIHNISVIQENITGEAQRLILFDNSKNAEAQLCQVLMGNSPIWRTQAEKILKLSPKRDFYERREKGKYYNHLLFNMIRDEKMDQAFWLIDNGADLNALHRPFDDQLDDQPILYSLFKDPNIQNKDDQARYICRESLIKEGANVNCLVKVKGVEEPLLSHLLDQIELEDARYLISRGANVNIAYGEIGYPILLHKLISLRSKYIDSHCGLLIDEGADVNARSNDGHLILTTLLIREKIDAVKFLIEVGGDIDYEDLKLKTNSDITIEEYLKRNGITGVGLNRRT